MGPRRRPPARPAPPKTQTPNRNRTLLPPGAGPVGNAHTGTPLAGASARTMLLQACNRTHGIAYYLVNAEASNSNCTNGRKARQAV